MKWSPDGNWISTAGLGAFIDFRAGKVIPNPDAGKFVLKMRGL